jgi:hypothetical protein
VGNFADERGVDWFDDSYLGAMVKKLLRVLAVLAISIFCLLAVALFIVHILQLRVERQAEVLLNDVRSLRLEISTSADVMAIVHKYQGFEDIDGGNSSCAYDSSYSVRIANDSINRIGLRFPSLQLVVKPQGVVASFMLNQGRLHCMTYTVGSYPPHDWKELTVKAQAYPTAPGVLWPLSKPFVVEYGGGNVWYFFANLKPDTTPEELKLTFNFDLSCIARIGGCVAACELMPTAWQEYQKKARERGLTIPRHELDDSRCVNRVGTDTTPTPD